MGLCSVTKHYLIRRMFEGQSHALGRTAHIMQPSTLGSAPTASAANMGRSTTQTTCESPPSLRSTISSPHCTLTSWSSTGRSISSIGKYMEGMWKELAQEVRSKLMTFSEGSLASTLGTSVSAGDNTTNATEQVRRQPPEVPFLAVVDAPECRRYR